MMVNPGGVNGDNNRVCQGDQAVFILRCLYCSLARTMHNEVISSTLWIG